MNLSRIAGVSEAKPSGSPQAEILSEARDATNRIVLEGRRKIEAEVNSIRLAVGAESEKVAQMIVERVVGQGIN